jgi:hypothetical protein
MCELCGIRPETSEELREREAELEKEEEDRQRALDLLRTAAKSGLKRLGRGCFRQTYLSPSGKFVYKVPIDQYGLRCNRREHELFRKRGRGTASGVGRDKLARCRLAPSGVLVMELVTPSIYCFKRQQSPTIEEDPPRWSHGIDTGQVGKARDGQWKAFDYGDE